MIFVQNWILSGAYAVLAFVSAVSEDPIKLTFMIWGFHIIVWTCVSVKEGLAGMFLFIGFYLFLFVFDFIVVVVLGAADQFFPAIGMLLFNLYMIGMSFALLTAC